PAAPAIPTRRSSDLVTGCGTGWHAGDKYRKRELPDHFGQRGEDSSIRHTGPLTKNGPSNPTNAGAEPPSTQNLRSGGSAPAFVGDRKSTRLNSSHGS